MAQGLETLWLEDTWKLNPLIMKRPLKHLIHLCDADSDGEYPENRDREIATLIDSNAGTLKYIHLATFSWREAIVSLQACKPDVVILEGDLESAHADIVRAITKCGDTLKVLVINEVDIMPDDPVWTAIEQTCHQLQQLFLGVVEDSVQGLLKRAAKLPPCCPNLRDFIVQDAEFFHDVLRNRRLDTNNIGEYFGFGISPPPLRKYYSFGNGRAFRGLGRHTVACLVGDQSRNRLDRKRCELHLWGLYIVRTDSVMGSWRNRFNITGRPMSPYGVASFAFCGLVYRSSACF